MGKRRFIFFAVVAASIAASGLTSASASAASSGGDPQIDQYVPSVPGAGGAHHVPDGQTFGGGGGGGSAESGTALPPSTAQQLDQLGPDGQATARLAGSAVPSDQPVRHHHQRRSHGAADGNGSNTGSSGGWLNGVTSALTGSDSSEGGGGLGVILPLAIVAIGAGGIGYTVARRRAGRAG